MSQSGRNSSVLRGSRGGIVREGRAIPAEGDRGVAAARAAVRIPRLVDPVRDGERGRVGGPFTHGAGEVELAHRVAVDEEEEVVPAVAGGGRGHGVEDVEG